MGSEKNGFFDDVHYYVNADVFVGGWVRKSPKIGSVLHKRKIIQKTLRTYNIVTTKSNVWSSLNWTYIASLATRKIYG